MDTLVEPQSATTYPDATQDFQSAGQIAYDPQERDNLTNAGFGECAHPGCGFMHAPGLSLTQTCPNC